MLATVKKIRVIDEDMLEKAIKYYTVLFTLNGTPLPSVEIELLAFAAIRGEFSSEATKVEFGKRFDKARKYIDVIRWKMIKKKLLIRKNKKYKVHPKLDVDFSKPLFMRIEFKLKEHEENSKEGETKA